MTEAVPPKTKIFVELGTETRPELVRWSSLARVLFWDSYALFTKAGAVLIDPVVPDQAGEWRLTAYFSDYPLATILTSAWHERGAYEARRLYGIPVWLPAAGTGEMEGKPDHLYEDGQNLPGGIRAINLDGKLAGDSALLWEAPSGRRVLFTGDAVSGGLDPEHPRPDHWRYRPGLYVLMHGKPDAAHLRARFRRLLDFDFDLLCSAHSPPVKENPKAALAELLESPGSRLVETPTGLGLAPANGG